MTSLSKQLNHLRNPAALALLVDPKFRTSLLFDPQEAAALQRDDVHAIGINGIDALSQLDETFSQYRATLFAPSTVNLEISIQDRETASRFSEEIRQFLAHVHPYLQHSAAHKAIEWLLYRFRIHQENIDELLACALPYHETNIFVRILQTVDLRIGKRWHFLEPYQRRGVQLPRSVLINQCMRDHGTLQFVCDLSSRFFAPHFATRSDELCSKLASVYSFQCATLLGVLQEAAASTSGKSRLTNELFAYISSVIFGGLSRRAAPLDATFSSITLLTELLVKHAARLTEDFFQQAAKMLVTNDFLLDTFPDLVYGLLVLFFDCNAVNRLSKRQVERLISSTARFEALLESLRRVAKQTNASRFLSWFVPRCVESTRLLVTASYDNGRRKHSHVAASASEPIVVDSDTDVLATDDQLAERLDFLNSLLREFAIGEDDTVRSVIEMYKELRGERDDGDASTKVKLVAEQLLRTCQLRFAKQLQTALSGSGRDELLLKLAFGSSALQCGLREDDEASLFACVHHAEPAVRIAALRFIENRPRNEPLCKLVSARLVEEENEEVLALLCSSTVLDAVDCNALLIFLHKHYSVLACNDAHVDAVITKWLEKLCETEPTLSSGWHALAFIYASGQHDLQRVARVAKAADCAFDSLMPLLVPTDGRRGSKRSRRFVTQLLSDDRQVEQADVQKWNSTLLGAVCELLTEACDRLELMDLSTAELTERLAVLIDSSSGEKRSQFDRKGLVVMAELTLFFSGHLAQKATAATDRNAILSARATVAFLAVIEKLLSESGPSDTSFTSDTNANAADHWIATGETSAALELALNWIQSLASTVAQVEFNAFDQQLSAFCVGRMVAQQSPVSRILQLLLRLAALAPSVRSRIHNRVTVLLSRFTSTSATLSFLATFSIQQLTLGHCAQFVEAIAMVRRELSRTDTLQQAEDLSVSHTDGSLTFARYLILLSCIAMNHEEERVRAEGVKLVDTLCSNIERQKWLCANAADRQTLRTFTTSSTQINESRHVVCTILAQLCQAHSETVSLFSAVLQSSNVAQLRFLNDCVSLLADVEMAQCSSNSTITNIAKSLLHFTETSFDQLLQRFKAAVANSTEYTDVDTLMNGVMGKLIATKCKFQETRDHDSCWSLIQRAVLEVCTDARPTALRRTVSSALKKSFFKHLSASEKHSFLERVCVRLCEEHEPLDHERITLLRTLLRRLVCALRVDETVQVLRSEMDSCQQTETSSRRNALVRVLQFLSALAAKKHNSFDFAVALLPRLSKLLSQLVVVQRSAYAQRMDVDMSAPREPSDTEAPASIDEQVKFATLVCMDKLVACVVQHDAVAQDAQQITLSDVSVESVVECVRDSDDPQLVHRAMQLLAALAAVIPDTVIDNVISIFVFVGSSLTRQDDQFTFDASLKLIRTLVPILCGALLKKPNLHADVSRFISTSRTDRAPAQSTVQTRNQDAETIEYDEEARMCGVIVRILVVFVDAFARIPEYRRLAVFEELVSSLIRQERAAHGTSAAPAPTHPHTVTLFWLLPVLLHSAAVNNASQKAARTDAEAGKPTQIDANEASNLQPTVSENDSVRQFAIRLFRSTLGFSSTLTLCARLMRFVRDAHRCYEQQRSEAQSAAQMKVQLAKRKRRQPVGAENANTSQSRQRNVTELLLAFNHHSPSQFATLIVRLLHFTIDMVDRADRSALPVLEDLQRHSAQSLISASVDYIVWLEQANNSNFAVSTRNTLSALARRSLDALANRLGVFNECSVVANRLLNDHIPILNRAAVCEMLTRRVQRTNDAGKLRRNEKDLAVSEDVDQLGALTVFLETCNEQLDNCITHTEASHTVYLNSLFKCVEKLSRFVHAACPSETALAKTTVVLKISLSKAVALLNDLQHSARHHDALANAVVCATQLIETLPVKLTLEFVAAVVNILAGGLSSIADSPANVSTATSVAWLKFAHAVFDRLGRFLSPYLSKLLVSLCLLHVDSGSLDAPITAQSDALTQLITVIRLVATQTSTRLLVPAIDKTFQTLFNEYAKQETIEKFKHSTRQLTEIFRVHLEKVGKADLDTNLATVFSVYTDSLLRFREQLVERCSSDSSLFIDAQHVDAIELLLHEPLKVVAFRVSEAVFRTYFSRVVRWAQDESSATSKAARRSDQDSATAEAHSAEGEPEAARVRLITLYNLCVTFAAEMEGLFNLFIGLVVPQMAHQLSALTEQLQLMRKSQLTPKKAKKGKRPHDETVDKSQQRTLDEMRALLRSILGLIRVSCAQDATNAASTSSGNETSDIELRFLNRERYGLLAQALVTQLENDLLLGETDDSDSLDSYLRATLVQFAHATLALHGEKLLSSFFQLLAMRLRDESWQIRFRTLTLVRQCTQLLGNDNSYKTVLNEFVPYIAEMNADPVDQVEELAGHVMQQVEKLVGESIREQL